MKSACGRFWASFLCALILACSSAGIAQAKDLTVFAAASLQESLTEAADLYAAQGHPRPLMSFAASSALARQIEAGGPAGLFISADAQWMDYLANRDLLAPGTRQDLLGNRLVLIAPATRPFETTIKSGFPLSDILGTERLALADPDSVPAGKYARAALTSLGVWASVEGKIVRAENVRAALALVERDEVRAGIVYATDAKASGKVVVAGTFPASAHPAIIYPLAIVKSNDTPEARAFSDYLMSPKALGLFERYGFSNLAEHARSPDR